MSNLTDLERFAQFAKLATCGRLSAQDVIEVLNRVNRLGWLCLPDEKQGQPDAEELIGRTSEAAALLQVVCHGLAKDAGWWTDHETGESIREASGKWWKFVVAAKLALVHSEVSEALEGDRKDLMDDHLPDRQMIEVELADAVIRICDLAGMLQLDLGGAIAAKLRYNRTRADHKPENRSKEGGKKL